MMVVMVLSGMQASLQESIHCVAKFGEGVIRPFSPILIVGPQSEFAFEICVQTASTRWSALIYALDLRGRGAEVKQCSMVRKNRIS